MTDSNIPIQFRDFGVSASIDRDALKNIMLLTQDEVRHTAARALLSCVAKIDVTYADKNRSPQSGSAFLYSDQTYLLASAHVVYGCNSIRISFDNGRFVFNGSVAYLPPQHEIRQIDLAIVKIERLHMDINMAATTLDPQKCHKSVILFLALDIHSMAVSNLLLDLYLIFQICQPLQQQM
ncbi:hypothetical protein MIR68_000636 [Amoeboaphelidium protococcarum]|nr:hypothetical protein MIR68_000636 [Amoeboaphelidium protococcarum]